MPLFFGKCPADKNTKQVQLKSYEIRSYDLEVTVKMPLWLQTPSAYNTVTDHVYKKKENLTKTIFRTNYNHFLLVRDKKEISLATD